VKKAAFGVVLLFALVVAAPASASTSMSAWWPFYEGSGTVAHDVSGSGNAGAISNPQWTPGYFGSGLSFDGATTKVDVTDSPSLEPANAVSVTAWVKSTGPLGRFEYIIAKGASSCMAASYGLYTGSSGGLEFYVSQNDGFNFVDSPDAGNIWDGNWHFVVGTYDGTMVRLYVDGSQVGTGNSESGQIGYNLTNGNDLFIGHYDGCTAHDFVGTIDEPTVWSTALTASQISFAYKVMVGLHGLTSRLSSFPVG
jgi:hypothetical protein